MAPDQAAGRGPDDKAGAVIPEVDDALTALLRRDVLDSARVEVALDAPTKDWSAKRAGPTMNLFLYDVREDVRHRQVGQIPVRGGNGAVNGHHKPIRMFTLSYLLTAWTQRAADEHRLLDASLAALSSYDVVPVELLAESMQCVGRPCVLSIGANTDQSSGIADVWPALGGELRPSLTITVTAPMVPGATVPVAALVSAPLQVQLGEK